MKGELCVNLQSDLTESISDQIPVIRSAGFYGIFFDWDRNLDAEKIAVSAAKNGLFLQSIHAPFYGMDDIFYDRLGEKAGRMTEDIKSTIDDCVNFGVDLVVCHAIIGMDNHEVTSLGLDRIGEIIDYAVKNEINIAFENTEGLEFLDAVFSRFGEIDGVGFCFDSGHMLCYNKGEDVLKKYGKYLFCTHLNDNLGQTEKEINFCDDNHKLPFDGVADWNKIADELAELKFSEPLTFEFVKKNRPARHTNDVYEAMSFHDYIFEAYRHAKRFSDMFEEKLGKNVY